MKTVSLGSLYGGHVQSKKAQVNFIKLGEIMLKEAGEKACQSGYGTTEPEWVGRYALSFGDINADGTLN